MTTVALSLTPSGSIRVTLDAPDGADVDEVAAARIGHAFTAGPGSGLLHLGAVEVTTALPVGLGWLRDLARRFMSALCAVSDLEELRGKVVVPCPVPDLEAWVSSAPPIRGGEYLTTEVALSLWSELTGAFGIQLAAHGGTVQDWLQSRSVVWNRVGRVVLHLAENKRHPEAPFAFLATYTARLSRQGTVQHVPLGRAVQESATIGDRGSLLVLLEPLHRASEQSALVKALVASGDVFHPLAWSAREAYAFLKDVPALEAAGVVVRVPEWWNARRPPRPVVSVTVGARRPGGLGAEALLDFAVDMTLDGEKLTKEDLRAIERATDGLALIRGRWVEIDRDALDRTLARWKAAQEAAKEGLTFHEAMRLVAGAELGKARADGTASTAEWSGVRAGEWLAETLEGLRSPEALAAAKPGKDLRATLRPYQEVGARWLWSLYSLGLGGCLADDMGLGKTVQVIALLLRRKREGAAKRVLLVVPASLIANWQSEIARFAPSLRVCVAHPSAGVASAAKRPPADLEDVDVVVTSYGSVLKNEWIRQEEWGAVVLDEAQAIKNPDAKQTRSIKTLRTGWRLALTGTPVENRLSDLWSIFDFTCPGLLGSAKEFASFAKRLEGNERADYAPLRNLVRPYVLRRLKTDRSVISDLPEKTEMVAHCSLTKTQAGLYQGAVDELARGLRSADGIQRRGLVLAAMMRLKQICNHPSHWLRDGDWDEKASGKFSRLRDLCEPIAARQEKLLLFTQFREATDPLATFLSSVFGREGLVLHGGTAVGKRAKLVESFQREDGPPFFVLSLKAGGSGLNLTAAAHVVHFDRWWNPAVESQATDRAFRIGQKRNVLVHKLVCRGTIEERIDRLIESKRDVQEQVLAGGAESVITELPTDEILRLVALDLRAAIGDS